jgi:hypothetical protein
MVEGRIVFQKSKLGRQRLPGIGVKSRVKDLVRTGSQVLALVCPLGQISGQVFC